MWSLKTPTFISQTTGDGHIEQRGSFYRINILGGIFTTALDPQPYDQTHNQFVGQDQGSVYLIISITKSNEGQRNSLHILPQCQFHLDLNKDTLVMLTTSTLFFFFELKWQFKCLYSLQWDYCHLLGLIFNSKHFHRKLPPPLAKTVTPVPLVWTQLHTQPRTLFLYRSMVYFLVKYLHNPYLNKFKSFSLFFFFKASLLFCFPTRLCRTINLKQTSCMLF